jgi:hypothetical protein
MYAKKEEAFVKMLEKADIDKQQLEQQLRKVEDELARATQQVVQRVQAAADKDEDSSRQLSLLRKVCCVAVGIVYVQRDSACTKKAADRCGWVQDVLWLSGAVS